jgi:hypothetical protein
VGVYEQYVPYSHFLLGIENDSEKQSIDKTIPTSIDKSFQSDDKSSKRGIFQRVVDRHRRKHKKKKKQRTEASDKHHPLHHLLEGASAFSHWKKAQKQQHQVQTTIQDGEAAEVDWNKWKYAMSDDFQLTSHQIGLVKELARRVLLKAKNSKETAASEADLMTAVSTKSFSERVDNVPWGGVNQEVTKWWPRRDKNQNKVSTQSEGARLLAAYLKIMKWPKVCVPLPLCLFYMILVLTTECFICRRICMSNFLSSCVPKAVIQKLQYYIHWNGVKSIFLGETACYNLEKFQSFVLTTSFIVHSGRLLQHALQVHISGCNSV